MRFCSEETVDARSARPLVLKSQNYLVVWKTWPLNWINIHRRKVQHRCHHVLLGEAPNCNWINDQDAAWSNSNSLLHIVIIAQFFSKARLTGKTLILIIRIVSYIHITTVRFVYHRGFHHLRAVVDAVFSRYGCKLSCLLWWQLSQDPFSSTCDAIGRHVGEHVPLTHASSGK